MTTKEKVNVLLELNDKMLAINKKERRTAEKAKDIKKQFRQVYKSLDSDQKLMYQDSLKKILECLL